MNYRLLLAITIESIMFFIGTLLRIFLQERFSYYEESRRGFSFTERFKLISTYICEDKLKQFIGNSDTDKQKLKKKKSEND